MNLIKAKQGTSASQTATVASTRPVPASHRVSFFPVDPPNLGTHLNSSYALRTTDTSRRETPRAGLQCFFLADPSNPSIAHNNSLGFRPRMCRQCRRSGSSFKVISSFIVWQTHASNYQSTTPFKVDIKGGQTIIRLVFALPDLDSP
jgi:hypothetical protein